MSHLPKPVTEVSILFRSSGPMLGPGTTLA
jgi:hypothetical protein